VIYEVALTDLSIADDVSFSITVSRRLVRRN